IFTAGCFESDGGGFVFKYDIPSNPHTLDPQTANCRVSALLIANLYDGLLRIETGGRITANVAAEYIVSEDGLTYTFLLRDDVYWYYDGDYSVRCTAYDFVFAFRRLFNPAIKSENAHQFYSIKNSREVHNGEIPYPDAVGVEAMGEFELVITLEHPNPLLPLLLTTTPAMPCSEELFEKTAGRYGLNANSIPSNGAFYITHWNYDPFSRSSENNIIIMRRNEKNSETSAVYPRGLNFFINYEDPLGHFTEGTTHSLIAEGAAAEALMARDYPYDAYENSVWGITFNTGGIFRHADLRTALAAGFDRNEISVSDFGFREAREIIPVFTNIAGLPYYTARAEMHGSPYIKFDPDEALASYERGRISAGHDNLTGLRVIIPAGEESAVFGYLSRILQEWQKNLGFFCTIETLSAGEFDRALGSGGYDIAMMKLTGEYNSPDAYLGRFTLGSDFNRLLEEAGRTANISEAAWLYEQAEETLLTQAVFIPVCFQTEMFFYDKRSEGLIYNPFTGAVIFREGKYF
ncbi:MAG: peptide ABC transporter substrate-binding protein, partial [Oscillospiraceae bacterium]|nr:peptide ABC transporter substrate-binding protein [Oscillospiraceae bacterium]